MSASRIISTRRALILAVLVLMAGFVWTRVLVARVERAFPAGGSFVEVDGARIHYFEKGSGTPIVLLHGVYGGAEDWRATIFDEVAQRGRAIAIDRPGHGYSDSVRNALTPPAQARFVHALLRELGVERALIVGFSWSGPLAASYALQFPDETIGVMTVNGALREWESITDMSNAVLGVPLAGPLLAHTFGTPIAEWVRPFGAERAFRPASIPAHFARSGVALDLRPQNLLVNAAEMRTLKPSLRALSPHYREIAVPLMIVTGLGDEVTHADFHSFHMHDEVAGSQLVKVEGAGHQILFSHPAAVLRALDDLLAKISASSR